MESRHGILLIESNRADAAKIATMVAQMRSYPVDVVHFGTLASALASIDSAPYIAIFASLGLPDSGGAATLEAVRARAPAVPIVVLANDAEEPLIPAAPNGPGHDTVVKTELTHHLLARVVRHAIERRRLELALHESEQRYRGLTDMSREAVLVQCDGKLVFVSDAAVRMLGAAAPAELIGTPFLDLVHAKDRDGVVEHTRRRATGNQHRSFIKGRLAKLDGTVIKTEVAVDTCGFQGKPAIQLVIHDATERRRLEAEADNLEQYDPLTDLPNRRQFRDRLEGAVARGARNKQLVGAVYLDLDRFANVNAQMGNAGGDDVLQQIAERLCKGVRKGDTVARTDGDEFALILEGMPMREGALVVAKRLLEAVAAPVFVDGKDVRVTACMGIAVYPSDADDVATLLRHAHTAMDYAKGRGSNTTQLYAPELDVASQRTEQRRMAVGRRISRLTPREREVLDLLVEGNASTMIGQLLGASTRAIDIHRARVMEKLDADSLPTLVRLVVEQRA